MAPATAPMIRPACVRATFSTSSRASDELTADAIASSSAARSLAPLASPRAASSSLAVPCRRIKDRVSITRAAINSTETTSRTAASSKNPPRERGVRLP